MTRNGTAVGELLPLRRRRYVSAEVAAAAFAGAPAIDRAQFLADLGAVIDQDPVPRG